MRWGHAKVRPPKDTQWSQVGRETQQPGSSDLALEPCTLPGLSSWMWAKEPTPPSLHSHLHSCPAPGSRHPAGEVPHPPVFTDTHGGPTHFPAPPADLTVTLLPSASPFSMTAAASRLVLQLLPHLMSPVQCRVW